MANSTLDPKNTKRYLRRKTKQAQEMSEEASRQVDRQIINRAHKLQSVWRFVVGWMTLSLVIIMVLITQIRALPKYYTELIPRSGGIYSEGIIGPVSNFNPIYATNAADKSISKLIFSGLFSYQGDDQLKPDLAESYTVDDKASVYTVKLRPNLMWHDGEPMTSKDIAYTVRTIQSADARSPLFQSWQGVTVGTPDALTIVFTLPGSFSPFLNLLDFGVLPEHILGDSPAADLRNNKFNSLEPIGTGPFALQRIVDVGGVGRDNRELKVQLQANKDYHFGAPKLDGYSVWVTPTGERLVQLFEEGEIQGASGFDGLKGLEGEEEVIFPQTSGIFAFFKTTNPLLQDAAMRRALGKAINPTSAINTLPRPAQRIYGPLLNEQIGFTPGLTQVNFNKLEATTELAALGWQIDPSDGLLKKDGQALELNLTTIEGSEYESVTEAIAADLRAVGVGATIDLREQTGFNQNVLNRHAYTDILVYGINIGVDPDVYAFWHSSQANVNSTVRLNLSEYSSAIADEALESGRSRVEPEIRAEKYKTFLEAWTTDLPAVGLYRPQFVYYQQEKINGPQSSTLTDQTDRYRDVHMWTMFTERVTIE